MPELVEKLESIFRIGGTVEEACSYAGINKTSYYTWIKTDESFSTKMTAAKHYANVAAKNVVIDNIVKKKDLKASQWWLERRQPERFAIKQNTGVQIGQIGGEMKVAFISSGGDSDEE